MRVLSTVQVVHEQKPFYKKLKIKLKITLYK